MARPPADPPARPRTATPRQEVAEPAAAAATSPSLAKCAIGSSGGDARARVERQAILDADDVPTVVLVLWEAVLHHEIGGPAVMARQCARLLELAQRPGVVVHIVKHENAGLGGTISLASVQGEGDTLLLASVLEDTVTSDAAQVRRAQAIFERVRSMGENATESRAIITEAHRTWQNRAS